MQPGLHTEINEIGGVSSHITALSFALGTGFASPLGWTVGYAHSTATYSYLRKMVPLVGVEPTYNWFVASGTSDIP